jgi:nitroreductase
VTSLAAEKTHSTGLELLLGRQSAPAKELREPAPDDATLASVFEAAVTAPDHGAIRPWRFFTLRGAARERLGDLFVAAARRRDPAADAVVLEGVRGKPLRAPLIVAVAAKVTENHPKVPPVEQLVSAAAAAQNILLALEALGYGAVLLTGPNTYDPQVKAAFGLGEADFLVGFIYVGSLQGPRRVKKRPVAAQFVRAWDAPLG